MTIRRQTLWGSGLRNLLRIIIIIFVHTGCIQNVMLLFKSYACVHSCHIYYNINSIIMKEKEKENYLKHG